MEAYALDWLNLLVRWTHVIVGIAWIGTSFYYIALDYHLLPPKNDQAAGAGRGHRLDRLWRKPPVQPARGLHPGGRDDRHLDGRQRPDRDHPRPARAGGREAGGSRARPDAWPAGQATLDSQQLPDAAGR